VHLLFYGSGANVSAKDPLITRSIIECQLIEEYHWLPQDIAKIPYRKIQTILAFKKQKTAISQTKSNINKFKSEAGAQGTRRGGMKKTFREV